MTERQKDTLMEIFQANAYPGRKVIRQLTNSFNVPKNCIYNWFSTIRHKKAKEGMLTKGK